MLPYFICLKDKWHGIRATTMKAHRVSKNNDLGVIIDQFGRAESNAGLSFI
jgi:hypothetical protein